MEWTVIRENKWSWRREVRKCEVQGLHEGWRLRWMCESCELMMEADWGQRRNSRELGKHERTSSVNRDISKYPSRNHRKGWNRTFILSCALELITPTKGWFGVFMANSSRKHLVIKLFVGSQPCYQTHGFHLYRNIQIFCLIAGRNNTAKRQ